MSSLASSPVVRHGKARFCVEINGKSYVLMPGIAPRRHKMWRLRSATASYAVVTGRGEVACSCPDSWRHGVQCKHIGALRALGLVPGSATVAAPGLGVSPVAATAAIASKGGA